MPKRKKDSKKFYAVAAGRKIGIYSTWAECQSQVVGFSNAKFKSFKTIKEAESFIGGPASKSMPSKSISKISGEIETFSKIAASLKPTKPKRPRVVAEGSAAPGSATNPIKIERPSAPAVKSRATRSTASTPNDSTSDGFSTSNQPSDKKAKGGNLAASDKHPYKLQFHVMFDGGSRGNPHGDAGSGTYVLTRKFYDSESSNSKTKAKAKTAKTEITRSTTNIRTYLGMGLLTNNQAEYTGLVTGLKELSTALEETNTSESLKDVIILIQGDSDLIVKQMNGIYACKSPKLKSFYQQSKSLVTAIKKRCKTLGVTCDMTFEHVYREHNTIADGLANEAMDAKRSWMTSKGVDDVNNNDNSNEDKDDENINGATEV
jgi:ribonuclease HI